MSDEFQKLIDEAIRLELNMAELYMLFFRKFPGDSHFWWDLAMEEKNHAALLKTVKQMNISQVDIPRDLLPPGIEEVQSSNQKILQALDEFQITPDRNRAFQFALMAENGAGELHYNTYMKNAPDSEITSIFKKLNGDDIDHAERIRQYIIDHQIPESEESDTGL